LIVFPLFVFTDYSNITATKLAFFVVCTVGFALAFIVCKLVLRENWQNYLPDLFLVFFLCSGIISWFMSPYFGMARSDGFDYNLFGAGRFDGLIFLALYAVLYWLSSRYCRLHIKYIYGFALVMLVMCFIAIVQLSGINALNLYPPSNYKGHPALFLSTIGNVDVLSGFMCLMMPMIGVSYVVFKLKKGFGALFLVAHCAGVYVMLSLGADMSLVGLVALIAVLTPILIRNRRYVEKMLEIGITITLAAAASFAIDYPYISAEKRTETIFSFSAVTAFALIASVILLGARLLLHYFPDFNLNWKWVRWGVVGIEVFALIVGFCYFRFACDPAVATGFTKDLSELARFKLSDTAGHHRIGIWRHSLQMAKRNLWFGTGCGTFAETFRDFAREAGYERYVDRNLDFAHNEYVHILCTMGVAGLIGYLGFLLTMAWQTVRYMYRNPKILVLGACVFGYSVWVFFCFSICIVTPIFWVLLGMLVAEIRETAKECKQAILAEEQPPAEEDEIDQTLKVEPITEA
ncbi:MAG: O-antigen ligase family protein, partial [Clostridia bacterium]|nr:O-antigen ligase family protein [Clostridia bacterium]